ncbi:hypothetical protein SELMODRAFT_426076 [Selaginella moellendorffii]|uniref:Apple domain-containing protein n=1 Tax=Selaginella moellendorffii TaxID=88036 RepID=D8SV83_SELML|nr:hypothetical protein SELMODRAFT_426076 [Selaginella moellendorffii]
MTTTARSKFFLSLLILWKFSALQASGRALGQARILPEEPSSKSATPAAAGVSLEGKWDHNYSCIFDTGKAFTYLHIAYVTYFNITSKAPTVCSPADCLDSCTTDCSCSAVVFDAPTSSCYQYHDYIPVQSIPFIPVRNRDTITAYIKVQNGYSSSTPPRIPASSMASFAILGLWVAAALNWVLW